MTALYPDTAVDDGSTAAPVLVRLRPVVQATQVAGGLHLRGWASSFTLGGGAAVWAIWQWLAPRLAEGHRIGDLCPQGAPAAVGQVVERLLAELWRHDMLVTVPADWSATTGATPPAAAVLAWLEAVADRPDVAWARLVGASFEVTGDGPVAWSAVRALRRTGLDVVLSAGDGEHVTLTAAGWCVGAGADDAVGFVLPPRPCAAETGGGDTRDVAARLGATRRSAGASPLHSLIGGAAAHRLVCAVGGLPEPGHDRGARGPAHAADPLPRGWRAVTVLVARMDPLRADHHPWLGRPAVQEATTEDLEDALTRLDALCDPELGLVEEHGRTQLRQVPAALGSHQVGPTVVAATAATADVARLVSGAAAVDVIARTRLNRPVVTGVTRTEAVGRALRAVWAAADVPGETLPAAVWETHPAARRWWKALTLHGGVDATMRVEQLTSMVHRATVLSPAGEVLAVAVEHDPGDAAAFAALAATGAAQWRDHDGDPLVEVVAACGATPAAERDDAATWVDDAWVWPARVARHEDGFARRLAAGPNGRAVTVVVVDDPRVADLTRTHVVVEVRR